MKPRSGPPARGRPGPNWRDQVPDAGRGGAVPKARAQAPAAPGPAPEQEAQLRVAQGDGVEKRVQAWLDVLVCVWRSRLAGRQVKFLRNVKLQEEEIARLAPAIVQLSRGFTGHRRLVGKTYLDDPELLGAYLLFYWPLSYAQAWTILQDQRKHQGLPSLRRVADLGSGPGPVLCALVDMAREQGIPPAEIEALAIDHSPQALALLREIAAVAWGSGFASGRGLRTETRDLLADPGQAPANQGQAPAGKGKPRGGALFADASWDLIASGHCINELWSNLGPGAAEDRRFRLLSQALAALARQGRADAPDQPATPPARLLVMEPALKPTTRALLGLRDRLRTAGHAILGPCVYQGNCPALASPDSTCHGQVFWDQPPFIRKLAQAARLGKDELAMAWIVVQAGGQTQPQGQTLWRVTSEAMLNKAGRTRYMLCGAGGRISLSLKRGELGAQAGAGAAEAAFFGLQRGDLISLDGAQERESGFGVQATTRIDKL